jgi:HEAT repeat protein
LKKTLASDSSAVVRSEAAAALGSFADPVATMQLAAALLDKSPRVRLSAVHALAQHNDPTSTAALKTLVDRAPQPEFALVALAALAGRGEDVDLSLPELTLSQKDFELKALAVTALAASRRPQAQDLLVRTMRQDADPRIRVQAAAAVVTRLRRAGRKH